MNEAIQNLKVGEGFEAGDLFGSLPSEEKVFWSLERKEMSIFADEAITYQFRLYYREIFLCTKTITIGGNQDAITNSN